MMWVGETYRGILVELVGGDVVDGEDELDVVLLGLVNERLNVLRTSLVKERVADLQQSRSSAQDREVGYDRSYTHSDALEHLGEGEGHTTADDQDVDLKLRSQYAAITS